MFQDSIENIYKEKPPQHPVALELYSMINIHSVSKLLLLRIIEARYYNFLLKSINHCKWHVSYILKRLSYLSILYYSPHRMNNIILYIFSLIKKTYLVSLLQRPIVRKTVTSPGYRVAAVLKLNYFFQGTIFIRPSIREFRRG